MKERAPSGCPPPCSLPLLRLEVSQPSSLAGLLLLLDPPKLCHPASDGSPSPSLGNDLTQVAQLDLGGPPGGGGGLLVHPQA